MTPDRENDSDFREGIPFLGGALWIDLLNSVLSPDGGLTTIDFLDDDDAFARWLANAGMASDGSLAHQRQAAAVLRNVLRPAFEHLAASTPLPKPLIARVNALLAEGPFFRQLSRDDNQSYRIVERALGKPHSIATRIAHDFAAFLTTHEPDRLKRCANPACTMVFYDRGKNNRRRWCSSAVCGNRDKVANYRARRAGRD